MASYGPFHGDCSLERIHGHAAKHGHQSHTYWNGIGRRRTNVKVKFRCSLAINELINNELFWQRTLLAREGTRSQALQG